MTCARPKANHYPDTNRNTAEREGSFPPFCDRGPRECLCFYCHPDFLGRYLWAMERQRGNDELDAMLIGAAVSAVLDSIPERIKLLSRARRLYARLIRMGCVIFIEHGVIKVEPPELVPPLTRPHVAELRRELEWIDDERREVATREKVDNRNTGLVPGIRQRDP